jgi:hypothetical protein
VLADSGSDFAQAVKKIAKSLVAQPEKPKRARRGLLPSLAKA